MVAAPGDLQRLGHRGQLRDAHLLEVAPGRGAPLGSGGVGRPAPGVTASRRSAAAGGGLRRLATATGDGGLSRAPPATRRGGSGSGFARRAVVGVGDPGFVFVRHRRIVDRGRAAAWLGIDSSLDGG